MAGCERQLDALDSAVLRLKIGMGKGARHFRQSPDFAAAMSDMSNLEHRVKELEKCVNTYVLKARRGR